MGRKPNAFLVQFEAKHERKLEAMMGEHFRPWEERYESR